MVIDVYLELPRLSTACIFNGVFCEEFTVPILNVIIVGAVAPLVVGLADNVYEVPVVLPWYVSVPDVVLTYILAEVTPDGKVGNVTTKLLPVAVTLYVASGDGNDSPLALTHVNLT